MFIVVSGVGVRVVRGGLVLQIQFITTQYKTKQNKKKPVSTLSGKYFY